MQHEPILKHPQFFGRIQMLPAFLTIFSCWPFLAIPRPTIYCSPQYESGVQISQNLSLLGWQGQATPEHSSSFSSSPIILKQLAGKSYKDATKILKCEILIFYTYLHLSICLHLEDRTKVEDEAPRNLCNLFRQIWQIIFKSLFWKYYCAWN